MIDLEGVGRAYQSWASMITRCTNHKTATYHSYGGRGITVCERWKQFSGFYADMGGRPEGTTLDRIDNGGNYELGNCRWADKFTQANNTRTNRFITYNGLTLTARQWARKLGVPYFTMMSRLERGRPLDEVFKVGDLYAVEQYSINGKTQPLTEWAAELGTSYYTLHARLARGWTIERTLTQPIDLAKGSGRRKHFRRDLNAGPLLRP